MVEKTFDAPKPRRRAGRTAGHPGRRLTAAAAVTTVIPLVTALAGPWRAEAATAAPRIIPAPASLRTVPGRSFTLTRATRIVVASRSRDAAGVATFLAGLIRPSTGYRLPVVSGSEGSPHAISLRLTPAPGLGTEGYRLDVTGGGVRIQAPTAAGLFHGVQTLRQLLPAKVEARGVRPGPWTVPSVHVSDSPRFAWRGAMLDVSRHFFTVAEVKRYIDEISLYKINTLHLHLSDDQGWRIAIKSWPRLATYGGSTEVGGGAGGYYTQAQYKDIVAYAQRHFITVVPEIDTPSHTNAALASYADLNCDGKAPPLYTGTDVGFSSLCVDKDVTYRFLDDVVGELARLTPGSYVHIGGDEAHSTPLTDYVKFIDRLQPIVHAHGKNMIGWNEIAQADVKPGPATLAQNWSIADGNTPVADPLATAAVQKGVPLVLSPANHAYLDMQYDKNSPYGLHWAGYVSVQKSYQWDPTTIFTGVTEQDVRGVEAPIWSETLTNIHEVEYMAFPRLAGIAEIGWSPQHGRSWDEYRTRLAAQGPRWTAMGVNFYHAPEIAWDSAS
ncbi:beta-N-acetylhexosaminidase [Actinoallomurus rhizosphaericola]|uniref:beta-N-acetylhexosaminidase n=1 Tax=Actinoallomurus rhizosphaericola TaxID=2952536 RepID=UPI00273A69C0|nr:beta-N-acetylhexosaminidase [Actinoallomurus rhizosphaericola]